MTLNELAKFYKETKERKYIDEIFKIIAKQLNDKASYTFYQKKFKASKYYFRLCDTHKVEEDDVLQELYLNVLETINRYDGVRPFDTYLFSTLWLWKPKFINRDFYCQLKNISTVEYDNEDDEVMHEIAVNPVYPQDEIVIDNLFTNLTEREKKIIDLLRQNTKLKRVELAEILEVSPESISQSLRSIKNKYKNNIND
jgi:RNA polymerase sigma factor (sigma-70 family)